jgi:hypothetical protein
MAYVNCITENIAREVDEMDVAFALISPPDKRNARTGPLQMPGFCP